MTFERDDYDSVDSWLGEYTNHLRDLAGEMIKMRQERNTLNMRYNAGDANKDELVNEYNILAENYEKVYTQYAKLMKEFKIVQISAKEMRIDEAREQIDEEVALLKKQCSKLDKKTRIKYLDKIFDKKRYNSLYNNFRTIIINENTVTDYSILDRMICKEVDKIYLELKNMN